MFSEFVFVFAVIQKLTSTFFALPLFAVMHVAEVGTSLTFEAWLTSIGMKSLVRSFNNFSGKDLCDFTEDNLRIKQGQCTSRTEDFVKEAPK
jgi:hypothetical protein